MALSKKRTTDEYVEHSNMVNIDTSGMTVGDTRAVRLQGVGVEVMNTGKVILHVPCMRRSQEAWTAYHEALKGLGLTSLIERETIAGEVDRHLLTKAIRERITFE